ncbi:MAG: flagellar biosynthesis/type III secretory pathway chaperone [Porticoccaceae bacterium]|jgi:flagellar biosynthesis/type III secretory pathway chaperone
MTTKELEYFSVALDQANRLKALLEDEFTALKSQDLTAFEGLQTEKIDILTLLNSEELADRVKGYATNTLEASLHLSIWDDVIGVVSDCKDLHRRNEIFMLRKLESIQGALRTIQSPDPLNSVDVYDRLGKVRPHQRRGSMGQV